MRVAYVRSDVNVSHYYLDDIENTSQRNFSSEPAGQSRYFHMPTDAELLAVLTRYGFITKLGSVGAATFDTTVANGTKLNIRATSTSAYTQIVVTSGAAVPIATIVADLNIGFVNAGLPFVARADATNHVLIDTTIGGLNAYMQISAASPSAGALHTQLGLATAAVTGLTVAALKTAMYVGVTAIAGQTGVVANITVADGVHATLTGLTGMTAASVGRAITLSGAASAGNNGTWRITEFVSATSVKIANADAVAPDANNGAITWTEYATLSVDVSAATINALSTFTNLTTAAKATLDTAVADAIAPSLVETGPVLLSFVYGKLSKLRSASFTPGSPQAATIARLGLPAGAAIAVVANDGVTPFTV